MIHVTIPGLGTLNPEVLVLDFNGTLALDGQMLVTVKEILEKLSHDLEIHILTSDTYGTVVQHCKGLPVQVKVLETDEHTKEKADYLMQFGTREVVAIGNGANDELMLKKAQLGIAVIGFEGAASRTLLAADVAVCKIQDAFGLLLEPKRLKASLRR